MFGLMTVARHDREYRELIADEHEIRERVSKREREVTEGWRMLAMQLANDLVELRKAESPPIPGPDDAATGSIAEGDAEFTPSALHAKKKAAK